MLNPSQDINSLQRSFKIDKRVKVKNFMQPNIAERLYSGCLNEIPFSTHYVINEQYQSKTSAEMAKLSQVESRRINNQILLSAGLGVGFLYEGYLKSRVLAGPNINDELSFMHSIFDYMGSKQVIDKIKIITGNQYITGASSQYTRFTPGHFLTRHIDIVPNENRLYAFVLSLTKNWHPDWGGLLQFYHKDGTPRDAWMPQFNVLSVFDVSHIHAVTYINPFASAPRLSLTGWFTGSN